MLVKIDEGLYINPMHIAFIAKKGKLGHTLDQDPNEPNDNILKVITGDIFVIKTDIAELYDKIEEGFDEG